MSSPTYQNVNWALTGVAGGLTVGRLALRGYAMRRLHWDDAVHLVAFLLLIIHGATNQVTAAAKAQLALDEQVSSRTSSAALLAEFHHVYQLNSANNVLLYLVFWVVKITFLVFYRMLFGASPRFMKAWWAIFIFTVLTYLIPFGGVVATCFGETTIAGYKMCNSPDQARAMKLEYSCAFNVATDVLIMALPLWMLRDLQMKTRQKLALAFIFSLAIFCIALDILRVVEALASNQALYTVLEINMVVIVSCLPTYSSLLTLGAMRKRHSSHKYSKRSYGSGSDPSRRRSSAKPLQVRVRRDIHRIPSVDDATRTQQDTETDDPSTGLRDPEPTYELSAVELQADHSQTEPHAEHDQTAMSPRSEPLDAADISPAEAAYWSERHA